MLWRSKHFSDPPLSWIQWQVWPPVQPKQCNGSGEQSGRISPKPEHEPSLKFASDTEFRFEPTFTIHSISNPTRTHYMFKYRPLQSTFHEYCPKVKRQIGLLGIFHYDDSWNHVRKCQGSRNNLFTCNSSQTMFCEKSKEKRRHFASVPTLLSFPWLGVEFLKWRLSCSTGPNSPFHSVPLLRRRAMH